MTSNDRNFHLLERKNYRSVSHCWDLCQEWNNATNYVKNNYRRKQKLGYVPEVEM